MHISGLYQLSSELRRGWNTLRPRIRILSQIRELRPFRHGLGVRANGPGL